MAKCVAIVETKKGKKIYSLIKRVSDEKARELVQNGYSYIPKVIWKRRYKGYDSKDRAKKS